MEGQAAVEVVGQLYVHCVVGGGCVCCEGGTIYSLSLAGGEKIGENHVLNPNLMMG